MKVHGSIGFLCRFAILQLSFVAIANAYSVDRSNEDPVEQAVPALLESTSLSPESPEPEHHNRRHHHGIRVDERLTVNDFHHNPSQDRVMSSRERAAFASAVRWERCKHVDATQVVSKRGCESKQVTTKMCYGNCGSWSFPARRIDVDKPGELAPMQELCKQCTPVTKRIQLELDCVEGPQTVNVSVVDHCECRVCRPTAY